MYVLQGLIICAVIGSNIEWGWTPNPHLAAAIGIFLAWVATMAIVELRAADPPLPFDHSGARCFSHGLTQPGGWVSSFGSSPKGQPANQTWCSQKCSATPCGGATFSSPCALPCGPPTAPSSAGSPWIVSMIARMFAWVSA